MVDLLETPAAMAGTCQVVHDNMGKDLATLLIAAMERRGDSQIDVARYINEFLARDGIDLTAPYMSTSQASISKYLYNRARPHPAKYKAFARYCGVTEGAIQRAIDSLPANANGPQVGQSEAALREQLVDARAQARQLEEERDGLAELFAAEQLENDRLREENGRLRASLQRLEKRVSRAEGAVAAAESDVSAVKASRKRPSRSGR